MFGLGTIVNVGAIVVGGLLGCAFGGILRPRCRATVQAAMGTAVVFIGGAGTFGEMQKGLVAGGILMMVCSLALGSVLGDWWDLDGRIERLGLWLRRKTGNERDASFANAFVTASLTVCVGAMAIVGSIQDGLQGNPSILYVKSLLDGVIVFVYVSSLGRGAIFSALPVLVLQGGVTLFARFLEPVMTPAAMANLGAVGNLLICCVGINLLRGASMPPIRVADMLPALLVAVAWAFVAG